MRNGSPSASATSSSDGLAEVVDDHRDALALARLELGADRRGLSRAEEPGDDVDRNLRPLGFASLRAPFGRLLTHYRLRTASASSVNSGSVRSQLMHLSVMLWP